MRRTGLVDLVEVVRASSSLGAAKPDPAAFHAALARLDSAAATAPYVGDRLDEDVRATVGAGLTGVWLNRTGSAEDPGDIPTIMTLADLRCSSTWSSSA